jgi:hypothetical protein
LTPGNEKPGLGSKKGLKMTPGQVNAPPRDQNEGKNDLETAKTRSQDQK